MATLKLLEEARSAGLRLRAEGDRLVIRGPKSAERIAKALLDHKAEVLPFLRKPPAPFFDDAREDVHPDALPWPCPSCGAQVRLDPPVAEELPSRFWSCAGCSTWGVTREGVLAPGAWVERRVIQ